MHPAIIKQQKLPKGKINLQNFSTKIEAKFWEELTYRPVTRYGTIGRHYTNIPLHVVYIQNGRPASFDAGRPQYSPILYRGLPAKRPPKTAIRVLLLLLLTLAVLRLELIHGLGAGLIILV